MISRKSTILIHAVHVRLATICYYELQMAGGCCCITVLLLNNMAIGHTAQLVNHSLLPVQLPLAPVKEVVQQMRHEPAGRQTIILITLQS
jgi:hypothetical protein